MDRKHYVEFFSPGSFFSETSTREISSWDTGKAVALSKNIKERYGASPYGFRFFTQIEHQPIPDSEGGTLKVQPKIVERSGMYYLGGELETYDDVANRNDPKESILRSNMQGNDWWVVIVNTNSYKSVQPFDQNSFIVDDSGKVIRSGNDNDLTSYVARKKLQKEAERLESV
jgi:hypothetical protein